MADLKLYSLKIKEFLAYLGKKSKNDAVLRVSASLSYTSLIALVPLLAIALAIFSAFPVFNDVKGQVQELMLNSLAPNIEQDINKYFNDFITATAKLTTIGVAGLAITAILLLSTIENSFNFIFKAHKPRRFTTKITLYWTVVTLGPLFLGAALSLKGYFYSLKSVSEELAFFENLLGYVLPTLLTLAGLMCVYLFVPNRRVKVLNAFCGAVVAVIGFFFLRQGFAYFVLNSGTYKTLYGAMAAIPIFLVWMYLAWAVVIFGAVVTAAMEEFQSLGESKNQRVRVRRKKVLDNRTKTEQYKRS